MESMSNEYINSYLSPKTILKTRDYIDWLYNFSNEYKKFSDDNVFLGGEIDEKDKEKLTKLFCLFSALDYQCMVQNVRRYTAFLRESNTSLISIYFLYKKRRFVITKKSSSLFSCTVAVKSNNDKNKHKYVVLDKIF